MIPSRNIPLEEINDNDPAVVLSYVVNALRTGATGGERHVLELHGFELTEGDDNAQIGSHFINPLEQAVAIKFSTGAVQPYWCIFKNKKAIVLPGYKDYQGRFDGEKINKYLGELGEGLKGIGFEIEEEAHQE